MESRFKTVIRVTINPQRTMLFPHYVPVGTSNQSMKPTAPCRNKFSVIVTTPSTSSRFPAFLVRFGYPPSRTPAVFYLGTSRVHSTVALTVLPAMSFVPLIPLLFNDSRGLSLSR